MNHTSFLRRGTARRTLTAVGALVCSGLLTFGSATGAGADRAGGTTDDAAAEAAADQATTESEQLPTEDRRNARADEAQFRGLEARAAGGAGKVRAIVGLQTTFTPEGSLDAEGVRKQRNAIAEARGNVVAALADHPHAVVQTFDSVPYVALELSPGALRALERSGRAASVEEDALADPTLATSTPLVEATESVTVGRTGNGRHVAILDTGVDKNHTFLKQSTGVSKVVSEACYSAGADCPGGVTSSTAAGSGMPCSYATGGCTHGTHVAGIAAGRGASFSGVAREAKLIAVQVFSKFTGADCNGAGEDPCTRSYTSDQIKGLERVLALKDTYSIASVNMSLGGGKHTAACDTDSRKAVIDNLLSFRIATVIASGNDGYTDSVSAPGCISSAVTVGSTTSTDAKSWFSNHATMVDLMAPGSSINSSVPGGGFALKSGTSMATPHVAGAWAVMRQVSGTASVATILSHLQASGKPVTSGTITKPRIRLLSASVRLADTGFKSGGSFAYTGGDVASNGVGLATRAGGPASGSISISTIPAGSSVKAAYLYWMTLGGPDSTAVFKGVSRTGTLIGASRNTCWPGVNQGGPNRVYRASIPVAEVPGNGAYSVSGVGGAGGTDGQGASLVVVYADPANANAGRVYIRHGAMSAVASGTSMSHTFTGLSVPSNPVQVRLHAGLADGQAGATEGSLLFNGTAVTAADAYDSTDGLLWDDDRLFVSTTQLPAGTTSRTNSITVGSDCLAWAYSALAYRT
ncbi:MAG TPA: S8 family serine peptidase [Acidimicrobiales bacterium]|nr:S8 family serine peptidase [Acidimicrobiales bacterium]